MAMRKTAMQMQNLYNYCVMLIMLEKNAPKNKIIKIITENPSITNKTCAMQMSNPKK